MAVHFIPKSRQRFRWTKHLLPAMFIAIISVLTAIPSHAQSSPYSDADIGSDYGDGFSSGSSSYNSSTGQLTINGSGYGPREQINGNAPTDQFHFTYESVAAGTNFRMVAKITNITAAPTGGLPEVGMVIRQGTSDVDDEGGVLYAPLGNFAVAQDDLFGNFSVDSQSSCPEPSPNGPGWLSSTVVTPITCPFWLQLVKDGNNWASYKSADGVNWSMIAGGYSGGPYSAPGAVDVGFAICNGMNADNNWTDYSGLATATISDISLNTSPVLPYETSWIGDTLTGDATGWVSPSCSAMWVDSSGDCFVNGEGQENDGQPMEYNDGKIVNDFFDNWGGTGGDAEEGSITGDNKGNIYFWGGENLGTPDPGPFGILMSSESSHVQPTLLLQSTSTFNIATGMAYNPSNGLLYVSDPGDNEILAINPSSGGEVADFSFTPSRPGPMTVDSQGRLWIVSEGNTPGSSVVGDYEAIGAPSTIYQAKVYCYTTAGVQQSFSIGNVTDTTKVYQQQPIVGVTDGSPIVITTEAQNGLGLVSGATVTIAGVEGTAANMAANGTWTVTVISPTTFSLNGSTGNGTYIFGGNVSTPSGISVGWNPTSIFYDSSNGNNRLLITDDGPDQDVKVFTLGWSGVKTSPSSTFGAVGGVFKGSTPGLIYDSSTDDYARFYGPVGVGTDSSGNVYVAENYNYTRVNEMADIRSLTSSYGLNWDLQGLTWTNVGDFDPQTGDQYTINQHYRMNYANGAGSEYSEYSFLWDPFDYGVIPDQSYELTTTARRIDGSLFLFTTSQGAIGDIDIYRMNGEQMDPCGAITNQAGGGVGITVWSDTNGDGIEDTGEVTSSSDFTFESNSNTGVGDFDVDASGNIWLTQAGNGTTTTSAVIELLMSGVNSYGVPTYSVASSSDYMVYNLPAGTPFASWSNPRIRYFSATKTLYLVGDTYEYPASGSEVATLQRINNFPTAPVVAWTVQTPVPDTDPLAFMLNTGGVDYVSMDVANDKLFLAEQWGPVNVFDTNTGEQVSILSSGPENTAQTAWDDCYKGLHAYYDAATNEYDVAEENSGDSGRQNMWRWSPFAGSPSVKSFAISAASDASPIVVTTSAATGLVTGQTVVIDGVLGNTAANGTWTVTAVSGSPTKVDLNGSTGNAAYKSGGTLIYGGVPGDQDFDSPTKAGSGYQGSGTYTVNGGGAGYGLSNGSDQLNMCWAKLDGNGSIQAQVTGLSGSSAAAASAGVMFRGAVGSAGTDPEVSVVVTESNGLVFQYRATSGGSTTTAATLAGITPSMGEFLMLARSTTTWAGDTFTAYYSANGISWTQLGSPVVFSTPMSPTAYDGLAVTAASTSSILATGTFDRLLVEPTPQIVVPPAPANFTASSAQTGVSLTWGYVTGAVSYNVYRGTSSGGETLFASGVGATNYLDTSAQNGSTYYYEVTAVGTGGESAKSSEQQITFQNWNPSFDWPVYLNQNTWALDPPASSAAWTFGGSGGWSGVTTNSSSIATIPAENGPQAALLENTGTISQSLSGFVANTPYTVYFYAAESTFNDTASGWDPQTMAVTMDTNPVSLTEVGVGLVPNPFQPASSTTWMEYSFPYTPTTSGSHTLEFAAGALDGVESIELLDNITINPGL